jgi:hypothetical protein
MAWESILEKHPDHVRLIGMISIENANLEMELAALFARTLFIPLRVGRAVYLTPLSAHARLDIFRNAAKAAFGGARVTKKKKHALKRIEDILNRSSTAINKRHRVIHDSWGYNEDDDEVSRLTIDGNPDRESLSVPLDDLKSQLKELRQLIDNIGSLRREFRNDPPLLTDLKKLTTHSEPTLPSPT